MRYFLPLFLLLFIGCSNNKQEHNAPLPLSASGLLGEWQLEATRISPGSPVDWTEVSDGSRYTFESDRSFDFVSSDDASLGKSGSYEVEENLLTLRYSVQGENVARVYYMNFEDGKLVLQFVGCIESCSERYRRIR
ncbi:lipocalin family protein [Flavobacteriaceae bacterium 3-367]